MFDERVAGLRLAVQDLEIDPEHRELLSKILDSLRNAYSALDERSEYLELTGTTPPWEARFATSLEEFRTAIADGDEEMLLAWGERALASCVEAFQLDAALLNGTDDELEAALSAVQMLKDRSSLALDLLSYGRRAAQTLASIEESQAKAQVATGEIGENSFVKHFADHARGQRNYAEVLRWLTVALIGGVTLYAVFGEHPTPNDWVGLISRGAVIAGVTAVAAYLARQSGQHRRSSEWAKSIEVQLRTFPAFVEGLPDDDRSFIVRQLAARILASPPEKGTPSGEDSVSYAQLLDVVSNIAKRNP